MAYEVFTAKGYVVIGGEITTKAWVNQNNLVRDILKEIGYVKPE